MHVFYPVNEQRPTQAIWASLHMICYQMFWTQVSHQESKDGNSWHTVTLWKNGKNFTLTIKIFASAVTPNFWEPPQDWISNAQLIWRGLVWCSVDLSSPFKQHTVLQFRALPSIILQFGVLDKFQYHHIWWTCREKWNIHQWCQCDNPWKQCMWIWLIDRVKCQDRKVMTFYKIETIRDWDTGICAGIYYNIELPVKW